MAPPLPGFRHRYLDSNQLSSLNDSAPNDIIPFVKNSTLTGSNASGVFIKFHAQPIFLRVHIAETAVILIPDPGDGFHTRREFIILHHIDLTDDHVILFEVCFFTQYNRIGIRVYPGDIYRLAEGDIKTFALTNCIKRISLVLPQYLPTLVDKISTGNPFFQARDLSFQKSTVIIVRNKANFITLAFFGELRIAIVDGHLPYLRLAVFSKGQHCPAEQILLQSPEYITLIFPVVYPLADKKSSIA